MQLSSPELEFITKIGTARFQSKRKAGISGKRFDGSECSAENDVQSTAAEYLTTKHFGAKFKDSVTTHGDGGADFTLSLDFEVVWLGVDKRTGAPRKTGHLLVNPQEPQRWADIYIVVRGSTTEGFEIVGWTTHYKLISNPLRDFGYGLRYNMHIDDLYKSDLRRMKRSLSTPNA